MFVFSVHCSFSLSSKIDYPKYRVYPLSASLFKIDIEVLQSTHCTLFPSFLATIDFGVLKIKISPKYLVHYAFNFFFKIDLGIPQIDSSPNYSVHPVLIFSSKISLPNFSRIATHYSRSNEPQKSQRIEKSRTSANEYSRRTRARRRQKEGKRKRIVTRYRYTWSGSRKTLTRHTRQPRHPSRR